MVFYRLPISGTVARHPHVFAACAVIVGLGAGLLTGALVGG
ncbi:hypothetical protein SAMN05216410_1170 [Sanguibacter gelidistatuariae]|uniref:Uncharacterized protein n=1 Tax=Sanguibacter gelidistatuariae TaxID=1814289 RepID=A0A1G6HS76_9MICO|nr:hypothetical protein [Sanguibacter gelidistatuariae]SDB96346.1 hypothetical protein SAMN05216410_1170 [Sanguibacter gelidistatuariae]